jgi:hypothetical protein
MDYTRGKNESITGKTTRFFLVFEKMKESFYEMKNRMASVNCGGLERTRVCHIDSVHIVEFGQEGAYLARSLGKTPHYELRDDKIEALLKSCKNYHIPVVQYHPSLSYTGPGYYVNVVNKDTPEYENGGFVGCFEDLFHHACDNDKKGIAIDGKRGTYQMHYGFTSGQCLAVDEESLVSRPLLKKDNLTDHVRAQFGVLSEMSSRLARLAGVDRPFSDKDRYQQFAEKIVKGNRLEAMTRNISDKTHITKCHMDKENDDETPGYDFVIGAWRLRRLGEDEVFRDAYIGYPRTSITDYMKRKTIQHDLHQSLQNWIKTMLPEERKCKLEDLFGRLSSMRHCERQGHHTMAPHMDKCVYFSPFAEVLSRMIVKFSLSLERTLECLLPVIFVNGAVAYRKVLLTWLSCPILPSKNLSVLFLEEALSHFPSIAAATGTGLARHQASFNYDTDEGVIIYSLFQLRASVLSVASERTPSRCAFKRLLGNLMAIPRVGKLTAQHLVGVGALVGLIPSEYLNFAVVCEETKTGSRLGKMGVKNAESVLKFLSRASDLSEPIVENLLCEYLRDVFCGRHQWKDVIYIDQEVLYQVKGDGVWVHYRELQKKSEKVQHPKLKSIYDDRDVWSLSECTAENWWRITKHQDALEAMSMECLSEKICYVVRPTLREANKRNKVLRAIQPKGLKELCIRAMLEPTIFSPNIDLGKAKKGQSQVSQVANRHVYISTRRDSEELLLEEEEVDLTKINWGRNEDEDFRSYLDNGDTTPLHRLLGNLSQKRLNWRSPNQLASKMPTISEIFHQRKWARAAVDLADLANMAMGWTETPEIKYTIFRLKGKSLWRATVLLDGGTGGIVIRQTKAHRALKDGFIKIQDGYCWYRNKETSRRAILFYVATVEGNAVKWATTIFRDVKANGGKRIALAEAEFGMLYLHQSGRFGTALYGGAPMGAVTRYKNALYFVVYGNEQVSCQVAFHLCDVDPFEYGSDSVPVQEVINFDRVVSVNPKARAAKLLWSGTPTKLYPVEGETWPDGWEERIYERCSGKTAGNIDMYWYTSGMGLQLRSWTHVCRFVEQTKAGKTEVEAWENLTGKKIKRCDERDLTRVCISVL